MESNAHEAGPRRHPRFDDKSRVVLQVEGRPEVQTLWTQNISRGGLFVETSDPPATGTTVTVELSTPDGAVVLKAEVVHAVPPALSAECGMPAGAGLQFVELTGEAADAVRRYADGAARLTIAREIAEGQVSSPLLADTLASARYFMMHAEGGDLYKALDVDPAAPPGTLAERGASLKALFEHPYPDATPPQTMRLANTVKALERVMKLLTEPQRRLEYDFRAGHVRVEERLAEARAAGPDAMNALRALWTQLFPDRHERAGALAAKSLEAEEQGNLRGALAGAEAAAELDPFNDALWIRMDTLRAVLAGKT